MNQASLPSPETPSACPVPCPPTPVLPQCVPSPVRQLSFPFFACQSPGFRRVFLAPRILQTVLSSFGSSCRLHPGPASPLGAIKPHSERSPAECGIPLFSSSQGTCGVPSSLPTSSPPCSAH